MFIIKSLRIIISKICEFEFLKLKWRGNLIFLIQSFVEINFAKKISGFTKLKKIFSKLWCKSGFWISHILHRGFGSSGCWSGNVPWNQTDTEERGANAVGMNITPPAITESIIRPFFDGGGHKAARVLISREIIADPPKCKKKSKRGTINNAFYSIFLLD